MRRTLTGLVILALYGLGGGCVGWDGLGRSGEDCVKPTIAVMKFENRAPFPLGWDLGDGMADVLVDRLVATGRYHVIERPELGSVLDELRFQNAGATRPHGRAERGRLKNVQYLVKGTITDFGHVAANQGFLGLGGLDVFGGSNRAVMGLTLYVVDVESGEIIASESLQESVRASETEVRAAYRDVAFGGSVFYRTPLGRATAKVLGKAVDRVTGSIAARPWRPKVAGVQGDGTVVINGGADRGVRVGTLYEVREAGPPIVDPDTGDLLGRAAGRTIGVLRVVRVHARYASAEAVTGQGRAFEPGQLCRPTEEG